ncbi:unnamed protein product, partial [Allacma fusca]
MWPVKLSHSEVCVCSMWLPPCKVEALQLEHQ